MNKVILMGRLTRDPEVRYSQGENALAIARYTLAVDRRAARREGEPTADFINWDKNKYISLANRMPITMFLKTHSDFFINK